MRTAASWTEELDEEFIPEAMDASPPPWPLPAPRPGPGSTPLSNTRCFSLGVRGPAAAPPNCLSCSSMWSRSRWSWSTSWDSRINHQTAQSKLHSDTVWMFDHGRYYHHFTWHNFQMWFIENKTFLYISFSSLMKQNQIIDFKVHLALHTFR